MFINSIETLASEMEWATHFFLNPQSKTAKNTFNFKSNAKPPKNKELVAFKKDLVDIAKNIEFENRPNNFQRRLSVEKNNIINNSNIIVSADKTNNHYEMSPNDYSDLLAKNVNKEYKLQTSRNIRKMNTAHKAIVSSYELEDRVFQTSYRESFITLKDHKPDFSNKPKCRLLNPTKPEVGRISHIVLEKIVNIVRQKTKLSQWKNVYACIEWFKLLKNKNNSNFIVYDIVNFYPSISEDLLNAALDWASNYTSISPKDRKSILQARKPLLVFGGRCWTKRDDPNFDVSMGSYDGAEICDICGLFLLAELEKLGLNGKFGSYKDDGLGVTSASPRQTEKIKQEICKLYQKHGLQVTIEANKKCVQFLDAEFDLTRDTFKPFIKPGDSPCYVHACSNHPPGILKNIPQSINKRLSALSSNEEMFSSVAPTYQAALEKSGYDFKLSYNPASNTTQPKKRQRKRRVIWWNPPYSTNVKTNVGKLFFKAMQKHFGKDNPLSKVFNKNTLKMSYRTVPNFKKLISSHNTKLLKGDVEDPPCNCQKSRVCPIPGECLKENVVYQATVTPTVGNTETYIGMTSTTFKERLANHDKSFNHLKYSTETELSKFIWKLKEDQVGYNINWRIVDRAPTFNPITRVCKLCTLEKYYIVYQPNSATLNHHDEIFKPCPHRLSLLLDQT